MGRPFDRRTPFFIDLTGGLGVLIVTLGFVLAIAGFIRIAVPPISHEVQNLVNYYPRYKASLVAGKGWAAGNRHFYRW